MASNKPANLTWFGHWLKDRPRVKVIIDDVELNLTSLGALFLIWVFLSGLRYAGYPAQRLDVFDKLHYYATLANMVNFLSGLIWDSFRLTFFGKQS